MQHRWFILLLILLISCQETITDVTKFKTGTFETSLEESDEVSIAIRNDSLQIEVYNNKVDSSNLRWINDCEVVFKTINPKNMAEQKDIHLKILTTTDSSYTYEYSYIGQIIKQKGIAYKIE